MQDEWRTADEVCRRYKVPKATLYRWNYDGTGPKPYRLGRHLRYRESDLREWEERQVAATRKVQKVQTYGHPCPRF